MSVVILIFYYFAEPTTTKQSAQKPTAIVDDNDDIEVIAEVVVNKTPLVMAPKVGFVNYFINSYFTPFILRNC